MNATREMNLNANGGVLYEYGNEYIVRGVISTDRVEQLAKTAVKLQGGDTSTASPASTPDVPVLLEDIADVRIGAKAAETGHSFRTRETCRTADRNQTAGHKYP